MLRFARNLIKTTKSANTLADKQLFGITAASSVRCYAAAKRTNKLSEKQGQSDRQVVVLPINVDNENTEKLYKIGYKAGVLDQIDKKFPELMAKIARREITQSTFTDSRALATLKENLYAEGYPEPLIEIMQDVADTQGIEELAPVAAEFAEVMMGHRKGIRGKITLAEPPRAKYAFMLERQMMFAAAKLAPEGYKVHFDVDVDPTLISGYKATCNNRSISSVGADEFNAVLESLDMKSITSF